ncbi:MAG: hypothetical protein WEB53_01310 [Akkermansiaceae bacterium]
MANGPFQPHFRVLLISAAVALGFWKFLPGTTPDRIAFEVVAGSFANPPLFVSGSGTQAAPWKLGMMTAKSKADKSQAPLIVSMGDDLEGYFQTSPPAPIDMAVIFSNFQRLGATKAATAAVLAWEAPDPIGLAALDKVLANFDSLAMASPLSRSVVSSPMPVAFRRASLPLKSILGDTSLLPTVNRIPLPGVILGSGNSLAGFSYLESEPATAAPPLLARWEDRVVLSFPLLTVMLRGDFPLDDVEVKLGEYLKLSASGPILPIDHYGRLAMPIAAVAPYAEISAEALIDGGDELFPKTAPDPVILRDDQSGAEPATRAFSKNLSAMVAAIASNGAFAHTTAYPRLAAKWEIAVLLCLVVLLGFVGGLPRAVLNIGLLVLAGMLLSAQWIGVGMAEVWLPAFPSLAAICAAFAVIRFMRDSSPPEIFTEAVPIATPSPIEIALEPEPEPESAPEETKPRAPREKRPRSEKPPAKKAAAKKTSARKTAARKTSARKSPPPEKPTDE